MKKIHLITISSILYITAFITQILQKNFYLDNNLYLFYNPIYFIVYLLIGLPILVDAYSKFVQKDYINEKILMSISTLCAYILGAFEEASAVMLLYTLGEYFLENTITKTKKMINSTLNNEYVDKKYNIGDITEIKEGQMILNDCVLISKIAKLDVSSLTGEHNTIIKNKNDFIQAGTINKENVIRVKIINDFSNSYIGRLQHSIEQSLNKKTKYDDFIQKFSKIYTPIMLCLALLIIIIPPVFLQFVDFDRSIYKGLIFLIVSCPCALVLIVPLSYKFAINKLLKEKIFIKNINIFEKIFSINKVYFDKTGTITRTEIDSNIYELKDYLDRLGIESEILTGDNEYITEKISKKVGISKYIANMTPEQKSKEIDNKEAIYIGDGINDALAISNAFIGIAINDKNNDITKINADIVAKDISCIKRIIDISKRLRIIMIMNILLILIVKAIVINLNLFGLSTLWIAIFSDVGVIFIAILNLKRL